jgi:hypothetical protein
MELNYKWQREEFQELQGQQNRHAHVRFVPG